MIANLNKDKTLKTQQTRGTNFLNNNWKNLEGIFDKVLISQNLLLKNNFIFIFRLL